MKTKPWHALRTTASDRSDERGLALITLLVTVMIVTMISLSLVGLMSTDMTHASIQYAVARSFFIAQAGLEEAKLQISASADPAAYATPAEGVTESYGSGQFTYWVDPGTRPETACGTGLQTLEAVGRVAHLSRMISTRVRACGVGGAPFLTALFGVSRIQLQGAASRLYLAPYQVGRPGGGGNVGSFTEINFADTFVRVNSVSEVAGDTVTLRDGRLLDYMLFGFSTAPRYDPIPMNDPTPWILSAFGDIIKAQPATGPAPNPCGTPYACVTVGNGITDIKRIASLREANYARYVYMNNIREEVLPRLALDPETYRSQAARNMANADINQRLGLPQRDAVYGPQELYQIVAYLEANPSKGLRGTVFVDGSFPFTRSVNVGDVTLAVKGDLFIGGKVRVAIRHDLSTAPGRRTPGIVVFGSRVPSGRSVEDCEGELANGSGRLVLCEGSMLTVDGLVYTHDGMAVHPQAYVDQVGAMYHDNRGTANPSFSAQDATVVLRFDPLALSAFGQGVAILSWQQLPGRDVAAPPPLATAPLPSAPATAAPAAALEPPPSAVPKSSAPDLAPASSVAPVRPAGPDPVSVPPAAIRVGPGGPPRPSPGPGFAPAPVAPGAAIAQSAGRAAPKPAGVAGLPMFHVQAGAFQRRVYAEDLARQLRAQGYTVVLVEGPLLRVWVGPAMSREAAEQFAARLRANGFETLLSPAR
jgi:DedD protein